MDISQLFSQINKLPNDANLQDILKYEELIFLKVRKEENKILQEYENIKTNLELQIFKKQKKLDTEYKIYQDILSEFYKKEQKYKFPDHLSKIQQQILNCNSQLQKNESKLVSLRKDKNHIFLLLQNNENKRFQLIQQQHQKILECDMLVSFWEDTMNNLRTEYQEGKNKLEIKYNRKIDKVNLKLQNLRYQKQLLVLEELENKFKTKNQLNHIQKEILKLSAKIQKDKLDELNLENLKLQIKFEKDSETQNKKKLYHKIKSITLQETTFSQNLHTFKNKKKTLLQENHKNYEKSINTQYQILEDTILTLKKYEFQILNLNQSETTHYQKLNVLEEKKEFIYQQNLLLQDNLIKLNSKKESIIPGIIQKYNFYMNFYHEDLGKSKIRINILRQNIKKLKDTNVIDILDVSESNQKINILKKLQIYINNKFYATPNQ